MNRIHRTVAALSLAIGLAVAAVLCNLHKFDAPAGSALLVVIGPATARADAAHDRSSPLAALDDRAADAGETAQPLDVHTLPPDESRASPASAGMEAADPNDDQAPPGAPPTPPVIATPPGSADVEQVTQGSKPGAVLAESFDGLGAGFTGPQGTARTGNPSDNSLAVGPDHIVQIVNSRMAIYTKQGATFDATGRALYGPVVTNTIFRGFGGACESRVSGDAVVRYDQLAKRWLFVLPVFQRGPARDDQVPAGEAGKPAQRSVPGQRGQPGPAAPLFVPPPPPPPDPNAPPAQTGQRGRGAPPPAGQPGPPAPVPAPLGPYAMCYAVSVSADPMGAYYRYEFQRPLFPDYPRPAIWPDGYYVPTSTSDNRISETVATQKHACVADRARMLKGEPATEQCVIIENVNFLNNSDLDGTNPPPAGAPNIMMAGGGRQLDKIFEDHVIKVWQFHVDWADPSKTTVTQGADIVVAPYHYLCDGQLTYCVPQPASERRLDAQGDKIMARLVYRNVGGHESVVAVHSVNTSAGGGGVRWYEFRVEKGKDRRVTLYQQGTYAPDGFFRWMASPAMDKLGNIGIGYSFGGSPNFAGQRFAGRAAGDPLGRLTLRETVLASGEAPEGAANTRAGAQRWEDYTQTAVDPSDDCTIWYVGDYVKKDATSYSSRIGAFRLPGCGK